MSKPAAVRVGPGVAAGIDEGMIREVVHQFYRAVRQDPTLGPIFEAILAGRWDEHLAKMCDFWSSVLLMTGRFKGTPMAVHARLAGLTPDHFARWLELFHRTVQACPEPAAALFVTKSAMIAQSLQMGIALQRAEPFEGSDTSSISNSPPRRMTAFTPGKSA